MSRHFLHLGELKTLLETKKVANDGILVLDKYRDKSEVNIVYVRERERERERE
jgi:cAMP-specific phosphodiesterase 4